MEGNKDEAQKCYLLAEKFYSTGNKEKALKFVQKSLKLYATKKAEELLHKLQSEQTANGDATDGHKRSRKRTNSGRRDATKEENQTGNTEEEANYTEDQVKAVLRIKNCKDFYDVLGVNKEFSESELKKSYRKLALQFHPDKNKAPGASEAFKRIGNGYAVLSDGEKRRRYDQYGETMGPTSTRRHRDHFEDEFEDISPEDIFNMFFGGGFPNGHVRMRRGGNVNRTFFNVHETHRQNESFSSAYPLVQLLPVLLIVLFSLLSSFLIPEPVYSFQRTSQYRFPQTTSRYGFQYFIKDIKLMKQYTEKQKQALEQGIEREFLENLQVRCYRERQHVAELRYQARLWGSEELNTRATNYRKEACEKLNEIAGA